MEKIYLIKANKDYLTQVANYRSEFLAINSSMDGCGPLKKIENSREWLEQVDLISKKEAVPEEFVQATQFLSIREEDNRLVGMIQVKYYFNDFLEKFAGHIGY